MTTIGSTPAERAMPFRGRRRQSALRGLSLAATFCLAAGSSGISGALFATPAQADPLPTAAGLSINSANLTVEVSADFPQALSYTETSSAKHLSGARTLASSITINGTDQPVKVSSQKADAQTVNYLITPNNLAGVSLDAQLRVEGMTLTFKISKIKDTAENRVNNLQIKNQDLVTVSSQEPGATVASAVVSVDRAVSGDTITNLSSTTALDPTAKRSMLAIAATDQLAAGFETNSLYDSGNPSAPSDHRTKVSFGAKR
ncbi:hypothetical protein [Renibacterium salmoninarum]|uniref:hypothetical protein n=1 Tax=Renibacterium salmoninarum TaxID=1646 RepID=UPI0011AB6A62|nr:hypothetical protein [Renibacterium salmoninarum]